MDSHEISAGGISVFTKWKYYYIRQNNNVYGISTLEIAPRFKCWINILFPLKMCLYIIIGKRKTTIIRQKPTRVVKKWQESYLTFSYSILDLSDQTCCILVVLFTWQNIRHDFLLADFQCIVTVDYILVVGSLYIWPLFNSAPGFKKRDLANFLEL